MLNKSTCNATTSTPGDKHAQRHIASHPPPPAHKVPYCFAPECKIAASRNPRFGHIAVIGRAPVVRYAWAHSSDVDDSNKSSARVLCQALAVRPLPERHGLIRRHRFGFAQADPLGDAAGQRTRARPRCLGSELWSQARHASPGHCAKCREPTVTSRDSGGGAWPLTCSTFVRPSLRRACMSWRSSGLCRPTLPTFSRSPKHGVPLFGAAQARLVGEPPLECNKLRARFQWPLKAVGCESAHQCHTRLSAACCMSTNGTQCGKVWRQWWLRSRVVCGPHRHPTYQNPMCLYIDAYGPNSRAKRTSIRHCQSSILATRLRPSPSFRSKTWRPSGRSGKRLWFEGCSRPGRRTLPRCVCRTLTDSTSKLAP